MNCLYIVIPAYNEAKNIINVIEEWYPVVESHNECGRSRLLIIDDGSKDDTLNILREYSKDRPLLVVMSKENGGHGSTIYLGYKHAIENGADYIFQTDSDGQTLAGEFDQFWDKRESFDALIGSRVCRGDGAVRKLISVFVRLVMLITFHVFPEDVNTPYRLMKREPLSKALGYIPDGYNLTNIALTGIMVKKSKVCFLPITFRPRQAGKNSINFLKIVKLGSKALCDLHKINCKLTD